MRALAVMFSCHADAPEPCAGDAVRAHLQQLFNSRCGQSLSAPQYGLTLSIDRLRAMLTLLPHTVTRIEHAVLATAAQHEPRLQAWRLREPTAVQAHAITLFLTARCRASCAPHAFDVHIEPSGRVVVST